MIFWLSALKLARTTRAMPGTWNGRRAAGCQGMQVWVCLDTEAAGRGGGGAAVAGSGQRAGTFFL